MGLFTKKSNNDGNTKLTLEDDEKLYCKTIWSSEGNMVVLFSYSMSHVTDALELISAAGVTGIRVTTLYSSYNEDIIPEKIDPETEEDIAAGVIKPILPETIVHQRNYLILSGPHYKYSDIIKYISFIGNEMLILLQEEFYKYCSSSWFRYYIDAGYMNENLFKYKRVMPKYDERINGIDDIDYILSKLPSGLTLYNILNIASVESSKNELFPSLFEALSVDMSICKYISRFKSMKKYTAEDYITAITKPRYMHTNSNEDDDLGLGDAELDAIFTQNYDRYVDDENYERISLGQEQKYTDDQVREYYNAHNEERLAKFKRKDQDDI